MSTVYIGIDNGVSGSIAILRDDGAFYSPTPVKNELSYTKAKQHISRINFTALRELLRNQLPVSAGRTFAVIERPLVNPLRFKTTLSAMRALEATLIVLEDLSIPFQYIDSRNWQKEMLPSGLEGPELKTASLDVGRRLFPSMNDVLKGHKAKDCDSLLMAEWARRKQL